VTSSAKRAIEDHFDSNYELESRLAESGKLELLNIVRDVLPKGVSCAYVRQPESLGLGHAVLCAKPLMNHNEPFAVLLADDLIDAKPGCLSQMVAEYEKHKLSIIAVQEVPLSETKRYGIVGIDQDKKITEIIEKPAASEAPSNLGVVGRYILTHHILIILRKFPRAAATKFSSLTPLHLCSKQSPLSLICFTAFVTIAAAKWAISKRRCSMR